METSATWRARLAETLDDVLDALYPRVCALCGAGIDDGVACDSHRLPSEPVGARCRICAAPLPRALEHAERCAACRLDSPGFARLIAIADYRAQVEVREWLLALKHGGRADLAEPLGRALARRWARCVEPGEIARAVLVPVPLHRVRRFERGYDQALLLARSISRASGAQVVRALARNRATSVQGSAGAVSRAANVHGAFERARWTRGVERSLADASCAWLVDDVVTSGSTVRECARVLRRCGAREVAVLAVARAARAPNEVGRDD
jgi:ComF family protein